MFKHTIAFSVWSDWETKLCFSNTGSQAAEENGHSVCRRVSAGEETQVEWKLVGDPHPTEQGAD